jgi:hypothetical protein
MTGTSTNLGGARTTRSHESVDRELIRAHLNLYAVLQNLEELVRFDEQAAEIVRGASVSLKFKVRRGPEAYLEFSGGQCKHGRGRRGSADISLYFISPRHLNAMFDGRAKPIPIRGFAKLGWLQSEFARLADRLASILNPSDGEPSGINETLRATLLLQTAAFASAELAALEPVCRQIASRMADGVVAVEVLPQGPGMHAVVSGGRFRIVKLSATHPAARITFRSASVATALLEGRLDSFEALATGDLKLAGQIASLDDFLLILDRVAQFVN